jgi:flagellar protein FlgJ
MTVLPPLPPDLAPRAAALGPERLQRIWKAAQDFEASALGELLKPIFATTDYSQSAFGGGAGESAWRPMLVDAIAKTVEKSGGLGLARPVFDEMLRRELGRAAPAPSSLPRQEKAR